mmetsp:Transcript_22639/g.57351  ORF Transcript_22639/g.57351 Transcript_22639/m.57351 type:complete len:251 (-) Transcript_22639:518-1270(-)
MRICFSMSRMVLWTVLHTSFTDLDPSTFSSLPFSSNIFTIGSHSFLFVARRFLMPSSVSSERFSPFSASFSARARTRFTISSSGTSKKRTLRTSHSSPHFFSNPETLSLLRGKPSMRNLLRRPRCLVVHSFILSWMSLIVISTGTMVPAVMCFSIVFASSDSGWSLRHARRTSPAEMVAQPRMRRTTLRHWVPFPAPGPPRTKTTCFLRGGCSCSTAGVSEAIFVSSTILWVLGYVDLVTRPLESRVSSF